MFVHNPSSITNNHNIIMLLCTLIIIVVSVCHSSLISNRNNGCITFEKLWEQLLLLQKGFCKF